MEQLGIKDLALISQFVLNSENQYISSAMKNNDFMIRRMMFNSEMLIFASKSEKMIKRMISIIVPPVDSKYRSSLLTSFPIDDDNLFRNAIDAVFEFLSDEECSKITVTLSNDELRYSDYLLNKGFECELQIDYPINSKTYSLFR